MTIEQRLYRCSELRTDLNRVKHIIEITDPNDTELLVALENLSKLLFSSIVHLQRRSK